jgi:two-component system sensor histidine kinase ArlS
MPVRIKITLLFTMIMFFLLLLLCGFIYYFAYTRRLENINAHLTNQALTTAKMLSESKIFDQKLMNKIDSATIISMKNKTIQAYNYLNEKIYAYSDSPNDTLKLSRNIINEARKKNTIFFTNGRKEAIAFYANKNNERIVVLASAFDEEGKRNLQHLKFILWVSFIGGTVIAFISGYFFSKILLRPVKKIADEVNIISAQSLAHRIKPGKADDEWNYLAKTLNDLLDRLQESFEIQRRFISSASHELSTPLTSISSQLEVALQRNRSVEDYRMVMQSVYQDVRELAKLTQTLLEFATASGTAGGLELNLIRIDEVLMRLPAEMIKQDKNYSVKLEFDQLPEDEEKLLVFGNAELLFTAIRNVVSNACKYSDNRLAKVKIAVAENQIIVSVEDNGKGISDNELKNIFHPFYRAENNRTITGFGVGLPLVKRIIQIHKGQIKVSSFVNKGTVVVISLPVAGTNK